eukprot:2715327-Amphidinium_carterae.1
MAPPFSQGSLGTWGLHSASAPATKLLPSVAPELTPFMGGTRTEAPRPCHCRAGPPQLCRQPPVRRASDRHCGRGDRKLNLLELRSCAHTACSV